jgi:hypothetical protein
MKFVVKESLSVGFPDFPLASSTGAASVDDALFGTLPIDFFRQRFGEDSSRTEIPEAAADERSAATWAISWTIWRAERRIRARAVGKAIRNVLYAIRGVVL